MPHTSDEVPRGEDLTPLEMARVIAGLDPDPYVVPDILAAPSDTLPGTQARVDEYERRVEAKLVLWHPDDRRPRQTLRRQVRRGLQGQLLLGRVITEGRERA